MLHRPSNNLCWVCPTPTPRLPRPAPWDLATDSRGLSLPEEGLVGGQALKLSERVRQCGAEEQGLPASGHGCQDGLQVDGEVSAALLQ